MKTKYLISLTLVVSIVFAYSVISYSQTGFWDKSQRITSGFIDKNPAFDVKRTLNFGLSYNSFLVFERNISPLNSNICVIKFGFDSAFGGVKYITSDADKLNRNPQLACKIVFSDSIRNAMIVWEKVENSRVNIYGCTYYNNVWSLPYPIDTGTGNKRNPHITYNSALANSYLYSVVYEKDGDIIFKNYESVLNQVWNDINLTDSISDVCRNPIVSANVNYAQPVFVVYERQKTNGDFALYYKKASSNYIFSGDTLALRGNNRNAGFLNSFSNISVSYESNFSGKWGIYEYYYQSSSPPNTLLQSPVFNYRNLKNFLFPIITNSPAFSSMLTSYIIQRPSVTKIFSTVQLLNPMDSITVGDSSSRCVMTLGNGLVKNLSNYARVWMVYEKDSAGFTTLDARGKLILINDIKRISLEVPTKFSLNQNYPNPFNPVTKIKFDVPSIVSSPLAKQIREAFLGGDPVKLKIFDITGREVQTLVNEKLQPGTYEATFDGSSLNSGVYFYQLVSGNFKETKKLILLK